MTAEFYGSAAAVILRTGVQASDLGLEDTAALTSAIEDLLTEATDLMNRRMRRRVEVAGVLTAVHWNEDADLAAIPSGLDGIANDIVSSSLRDMVATRQTPVVRVDDFAVRTLAARVFSPDIERRLRLYSSAALGSIDVDPGLATTAVTLTAADLNALDSGAGEGL